MGGEWALNAMLSTDMRCAEQNFRSVVLAASFNRFTWPPFIPRVVRKRPLLRDSAAYAYSRLRFGMPSEFTGICGLSELSAEK